MSSTIANQVDANDYYRAIQLALGTNGGTVTFNYANDQSAVTLSRASPTAQTSAESPTDVVYLSEDAKSALATLKSGKPTASADEDAQVALTLLASSEPAKSSSGGASPRPPANNTGSTGVTSGQGASDAQQLQIPNSAASTPVAADQASSDSSGTIANILNAANTADPTAAFYSLYNRQQAAFFFTTGQSSAYTQSFLTAYDNRTLNIQNAANVPGLLQGSAQISATSETSSLGFNPNWQPANGDNFGGVFGSGINFLVTWPPSA